MPYDKAQAAAYQAQQYQNMKSTLQSVMDSYERNPELIAEMLEFKNRFYNYSINNTQLIYEQNPAATYVGSYQKWNEQGYHVRKGQKGIKIFVPIKTQLFQIGEQNGKKQFKKVSDATPEEQEQINSGRLKPFLTTRFTVGNVFDISQTDCPPEDYPKLFHMGYSSEQHAKLYDVVKAYAESKEHPVLEKDLQSIALRGQFFPLTGGIEISDKLNDTEKLSTLTHELGHALLHGVDENKPASVVELEADCISIMLQKELGIDLTDSRKNHFVQHFNKCKDNIKDFKLDEVLKNVNAAYFNLRNEIDPMIEQAMAQAEKAQDTKSALEALTPEQKEEIINGFEMARDYGVADHLSEQDLSQYDTIIEERAAAAKKENVPTQEHLMEQQLKDLYPTMKTNAGYYILDEVPGYAVGFNPKAPEALVLWSVYENNDYRDGIYRHTLSGFDYRDLVESGLHVERIEEILSEVGYTYEPMVTEDVQQSEPTTEPTAKQPTSPSALKSRTDFKEQDAAVLEYIKHNVPILKVAEDMGFTPQKIGTLYTLKEHDSVRFYEDTNSFHRFSTNVGGSTIDFVKHFGGMNEKEAIQSLKDKYLGNRFDALPPPPPVQPAAPKEQKPFELPEKADGKFARAFAYLTKTRCLDADIVQRCMKDGLIYEDNKHNVVFVGTDEGGKPAYATRHTTLTNSDFKRDVAGSRQDIGFMVDNKADKLYVCEAPIDALSIMCLRKHQGQDCNKASYLATCGTGKDIALYNRLKQHPNIKNVVLANDNDEAGQKANRKIYDHLKANYPQINVSYLRPKEKDINEHLCKFCEGKCTPTAPKKNKVKEVER